MIRQHDRTDDSDDRPMWDALYGMFNCLAIVVSRDVGIYARLGERPQTIDELCAATSIARRPMQALLSANAGANLVRVDGDTYALSTVGATHLLEESPGYFGGVLDMVRATYGLFTPAGLAEVVRANKPKGYGAGEIFRTHAEQVETARMFTRAMHGMSACAAAAWPDALDLERVHTMLDIGGGSGVHSIAAVSRWPALRATVFELPSVGEVTREYVARFGVHARVAIHGGDMWKDPFPSADMHFYSMVFHDWPADKCQELAQKSFESLPPSGMIVLHDMFMAEDHSGPATVAALGLSMLFGTEGQQYTVAEMTTTLERAGFCNVRHVPTFGYWSLLIGTKPSAT